MSKTNKLIKVFHVRSSRVPTKIIINNIRNSKGSMIPLYRKDNKLLMVVLWMLTKVIQLLNQRWKTVLFTGIAVVIAFLMSVPQAPAPTVQRAEGQVPLTHAVRCITAELLVEVTSTFCSRHKHAGHYILRKRLYSLYLQICITALCSKGYTISTSRLFEN